MAKKARILRKISSTLLRRVREILAKIGKSLRKMMMMKNPRKNLAKEKKRMLKILRNQKRNPRKK